MSASFIRAFFAIDLPPEHKRQLGAYMDALKQHFRKTLKHHHSFRWVKPENLHLTLQFLGQINEDESTELLRQVSGELEGVKPFNLSLGPLEWFPSPYRPRVLSLQASPYEPMAELAQLLGKSAVALGYAVEDRPFRAHLTLARLENMRNLEPELLRSFPWEGLPELFVHEVVFFRSETLSSGSVYTRLAGLELAQSED